MIIDLIKDKSNIIICSYKDNATNNFVSSSFSTKTLNDIMYWSVYNKKINKINLTIISNSICNLKSISYNIPSFISRDNIKIETSIDYINWNEIPFQDIDLYGSSVTAVDDVDLKNLSTSGGNLVYYLDQNNPEIRLSINDDNHPRKYIFGIKDQYSNVTHLYNKYEFQMLRFTFTGLSDLFDIFGNNRLKFNKLEILIDETFDETYSKKNIMSVRSLMFSKPKIYSEYPFLPNIVSTYMKMLEENNNLGIDNEYKNTYLQKTTFDISMTKTSISK